MSWTSAVKCTRCGARDWTVVDGVWTCACGAPIGMPRPVSDLCRDDYGRVVCVYCHPTKPCDPDCPICWPRETGGKA